MFEKNKYELWQGDCRELLKTIPNCSVDLILTDPPYKMNHSTGGCSNIGFKNKWGGNIKAGNTVMGFDLTIKFSEWLPEAYRVLKESGHCYIFCNDKNIRELLNVSNDCGFKESNILVWKKNNCTPNRYYMKNCEFIIFFYKGKAKPINDLSSTTFMECKNINGKVKKHPTQKPVEILHTMILNSTKEKDIVLDLFMGSGSTGVASIEANRKFLGIEKEQKYFDVATERIKETDEKRKANRV